MYVANLYNPLTWIYFIIGMVITFCISPFITESIQKAFKTNIGQFFKEKHENPKNILKYLGIVKKVKK